MEAKKQSWDESHFNELELFSIADELEARAGRLKKSRKRIRTRAQLVAATAREIERTGYDGLTIEGITEAAGMARGTFYLYYNNRTEAATRVFFYYWALIRQRRPKGGVNLTPQESIHRMSTFSVGMARLNAGLLVGRETLMRENPLVGERLEFINTLWADRIVKDLERRGVVVENSEDREFLRLKARAIITMSDALLRDIYRTPEGKGQRPTPPRQRVIRVMDDLWYRTLYSLVVV